MSHLKSKTPLTAYVDGQLRSNVDSDPTNLQFHPPKPTLSLSFPLPPSASSQPPGSLLRSHGSPARKLELRRCGRSLAGAAAREEEGGGTRSSRSSAPPRGPCSAARGRGRPPAMEGREEGLAARRSLGSDELELGGTAPRSARSRPLWQPRQN